LEVNHIHSLYLCADRPIRVYPELKVKYSDHLHADPNRQQNQSLYPNQRIPEELQIRQRMREIPIAVQQFLYLCETRSLSLRSSLAYLYEGADKSLARPISRCILLDGENISFDASLVIYINSTNIPPIMIINRIYETQNLLSL
jgi:hypothetical protein